MKKLQITQVAILMNVVSNCPKNELNKKYGEKILTRSDSESRGCLACKKYGGISQNQEVICYYGEYRTERR